MVRVNLINHLASGWGFLKTTGTTLNGWPLNSSVLNELSGVNCNLNDWAKAVVLERTRFLNADIWCCSVLGQHEEDILFRVLVNDGLISKGLELLEEKKYHLWGVYFHFGEMCLMEGGRERAEDFFKKCLTHNPYHKKAGSYLKLKKKL